MTESEKYADSRIEGSYFESVLTAAQLSLLRKELRFAFEAGQLLGGTIETPA